MEDLLIIGVDIVTKDVPTISIARRTANDTIKHFKTIYGEEAIEIYEKLTDIKVEKEKKTGILYTCDGKACDHPCSEECKHTTDISHATSFTKEHGTYVENDTKFGFTVEEIIERSKRLKDLGVNLKVEGRKGK